MEQGSCQQCGTTSCPSQGHTRGTGDAHTMVRSRTWPHLREGRWEVPQEPNSPRMPATNMAGGKGSPLWPGAGGGGGLCQEWVQQGLGLARDGAH